MLRSVPRKNRVIYVLLGICFGIFGVHNFYAGRNRIGGVQLFLALFCGGVFFVPFWVLTELFAVRKDSTGQEMESYAASCAVALIGVFVCIAVFMLALSYIRFA